MDVFEKPAVVIDNVNALSLSQTICTYLQFTLRVPV